MSRPVRIDHAALANLHVAVVRSRRKTGVALPDHFVFDHAQPPALAQLFRSGQAPLKVYLTLRMLATASPYVIDAVPAADVAKMLALGSEAPGARRVRLALQSLQRLGLIELTPKPGQSPKVRVLHPPREEDKYWVLLPVELWRNGWILAMSGAALVVYTALKRVVFRRPNGAWIKTADRPGYGLSDDTWSRGTDELSKLGLARAWQEHQHSFLYPSRNRMHYQLDAEYLAEHLADGTEVTLDVRRKTRALGQALKFGTPKGPV